MPCFRETITCAILLTAVTWGHVEATTMDDTIAKIRKMASQEIPYEFGTIREVTIVPNQSAVRLKCSDNPETVREILIGADSQVLNRILQSNTTEEAITILKEANLLQRTFDRIAEKVSSRVSDRVEKKAKISVIMVSLDGVVLGTDENARSIKPWQKSP